MIQEFSKHQQEVGIDVTLFEATPGLRFVFLPDDELPIIAASKDMCRFIGVDRASVVGVGLEQLCQIDFFYTQSDLYKTLKASLAHVLQFKASHSNDNIEYKQSANGGRLNEFRWKTTSTPVLNDDGEIRFIIFTAEDWDAKAETRLRKTFNIDTVGVIYFDLDGGIHDANPAFERMSGYSREEFVSGKVRWDQLTPPEFMEVTFKSREEFLSRWQNTPYEKQYLRPDGTLWWGLFAGKRLSDNECVEFVLDITLLKNVEHDLEKRVKERTKELEYLNHELLRSNNSLEQFAYAASHDLKEPIRKIQLFADRLRRSVEQRLTEQEKNFIDRMINSTIRMSQLVDDLLSYSHLNFSSSPGEDVDLDAVLSAVLSDLDVQIEERNAAISIGNLPTMKGNRRQLQQAFQNLLSNALKYQKPGMRPEITITCEQVAGEEIKNKAGRLKTRYYLIKFKDNGIGFEQQYAEQIFDVFTRLHGGSQFQGTGVGLSIVRKVVENHNGFVTAASQPGHGAVFNLYLPVAQ